MYLQERLQSDSREQVAFMVTLAHDEYVEQLMNDQLEPRNEEFDDWLGFIGWAAVRMTVPKPRVA